MTGCTVRRYEQSETSPETIEQELRPAVCKHRLTDRLKENYSIDSKTRILQSLTKVLLYSVCPYISGYGYRTRIRLVRARIGLRVSFRLRVRDMVRVTQKSYQTKPPPTITATNFIVKMEGGFIILNILKLLCNTVVPVMNGHPRDQAKVSVHCRWPLIRGNLTLKCVGRGIDNVAVQGRWPLTTGVAQGRYYCTRIC